MVRTVLPTALIPAFPAGPVLDIPFILSSCISFRAVHGISHKQSCVPL